MLFRFIGTIVRADFCEEPEVDMTNAPSAGRADADIPRTILRYGGFWIRLVASVLDSLLLSLSFALVAILSGLDFSQTDPEHLDWKALVMQIVVCWLYEAALTSSARGATVGKMAVGLRVVTADGERLTFLRATARYLAKYVSALLFGIGFLMVAFAERKRALHDMIADTVVIKVD